MFFSPGAAFADIAKRPSWWVPIVLSMIVTTVFLYLFSERVGWENFISRQLDQTAQGQTMSAQQRQQVLGIYAVAGKAIAFGGGLLGPIISNWCTDRGRSGSFSQIQSWAQGSALEE